VSFPYPRTGRMEANRYRQRAHPDIHGGRGCELPDAGSGMFQDGWTRWFDTSNRLDYSWLGEEMVTSAWVVMSPGTRLLIAQNNFARPEGFGAGERSAINC
jgi:hypothetical protein